MRTLKLTLAYNGGNYAGWQVQPDQRTLQGEIESALTKITGSTVRAVASGRTDAGVHALGQVVSFSTESQLSADVFVRALNAKLPRDMAVLWAVDVPVGFNARRDAVRKQYRYVIDDGPVRDVFRLPFCWKYHGQLNAPAMHRAAQALAGKHDFRSFESEWPNRATSVRTVEDINVRRRTGSESDVVTLEITADGFLYNMVRSIVGTLVEVGTGARGESWPAEVLAAEDRSVAGMTAPPEGLFLVKVEYYEL